MGLDAGANSVSLGDNRSNITTYTWKIMAGFTNKVNLGLKR